MRVFATASRLAPKPNLVDLALQSAIVALGLLASSTLVLVLRTWSNPEALGVVYLPAVLGAAFFWGKRAGILTAILAVGLFDYVFLPQRQALSVGDSRLAILLAVFIFSAVTVAELAARERRRSAQAFEREREAALLAGISSALVSGATLSRAQADAARVAASAIGVPGANIVLGRGPLPGQIAIPLTVESNVIGRLELHGAPPEIVNDVDALRVAASLAGLLALASERERLATADVEAAALRNSDALKTALLRAVSHELRTPLTAIKATVSALLGNEVELDPATVRDLLEDVSHETDRLERLVSDLLDFSRLQAGSARSALDWNEAADLLRSAVAAAKPRVAGTAIELEVPTELPLVRCDATQIERVLVNLIENAAKFSPSGEPVHVSAHRQGDNRVVFDVRDSGPGIPTLERDRVFEPFYRGSTRGASGGTGLGLAIARGFVAANDGEIRISDAPSGGALIELELPALTVPLHSAVSS